MAIDASTTVEQLRAATVVSSDGSKIGKVGDVYLGDSSSQPEWVTVKTGLFGTAETFVPLADASSTGDEIRVPYSKDKVKDAPRTEADGQISVEEEDSLFSYYGIGQASGQDSGQDGAQTGGRHTAGGGDGYVEGSGQDRGDYENLDDLGAGRGTAGPGAVGVTGGTGGTAENTSDSRRDRAGEAGVQGRDTSGPTTDEAMTRSEERLQVGTERRESGRARLRKHVVTEHQSVEVPTSHEEVTIQREPITDANRGAATSGAQLSEEEHEVVLHEEVPVVSKTVEAQERVRLGTQTERDTQTVAADVRKEQIDVDKDGDLDLDADAARARAGRGDRDAR